MSEDQKGMFGSSGTGDTSGYGGLVRTAASTGSTERPYGGYFDDVADDLERGVLELLQADAAAAHVELPARLGPRVLEPRALGLVVVDAHEVDRHGALLAGERGHEQRLLRVAVIAARPDAVRHGVADHAVEHAFFIVLVEVLEDDLAERLDARAAVGVAALPLGVAVEIEGLFQIR